MVILPISPVYIAQIDFDEARWRSNYPGAAAAIVAGTAGPGIKSGWDWYIIKGGVYGYKKGQLAPIMPAGAVKGAGKDIPPSAVIQAPKATSTSVGTGAATPSGQKPCCGNCGTGTGVCADKQREHQMFWGGVIILVVIVIGVAVYKAKR